MRSSKLVLRYLHPGDHHAARIRKTEKDFAKLYDFKDRLFPLKIEIFTKLKKNNSIEDSVFDYEIKEDDLRVTYVFYSYQKF